MVGATLLTLMMSCGIWTDPDMGASYQAFEKKWWSREKVITPDAFTRVRSSENTAPQEPISLAFAGPHGGHGGGYHGGGGWHGGYGGGGWYGGYGGYPGYGWGPSYGYGGYGYGYPGFSVGVGVGPGYYPQGYYSTYPYNPNYYYQTQYYGY